MANLAAGAQHGIHKQHVTRGTLATLGVPGIRAVPWGGCSKVHVLPAVDGKADDFAVATRRLLAYVQL